MKNLNSLKFKAIHKITKEEIRIGTINVESKQFTCLDGDWGVWHNYSKRGFYDILVEDKNIK